MIVDRKSNEPLHVQIKNIINDQISDQILKPGDRLPSERELCTEFNVSRMTIRSSLADLEMEGVIKKIQGKGTFVSSEKFLQPLQKLRSFTEDMRDRGLIPSSKILMFEIIPAGKHVAKKLEVPIGSDVIILKRLRLADSIPMAIETSYLIPSLCKPLLLTLSDNDSLYHLMRDVHGIELISAQQSIEVSVITGWEANMLEVVNQAPILITERLTYTKGNLPVEYATSKYRGDRYKFFIDLQAQ